MKSDPPEPVSQEDKERLKVLVVDDVDFHAETVAETLERIGYQCEVVTSGEDGARRIEEDEFHVILTDLIMEDYGGLEILQLAKNRLPDASVIVITGHHDVKSAVQAMQQDCAN